MKRLWFFVAFFSLLAPMVVAAQVSGTQSGGSQPALVTLIQPSQPSSGQAFPGATVAAVAITISSNTLVDVTGIKVQKVGSASNASLAGLQVNTDQATVVGSVSGFDANNSVTIPVSATINGSKIFLVSAVMASNLTPYAGQSFELNITGVTTNAVSQSGTLPVYGAQFLLSTGVAKPVCAIHANTSSYQIGQTINITWQSSNATGGTISGIGNVGPNGLQGILPGGQSQTLVGTFTGPGGTATCSLTLTLTTSTGGTISSSDSGGVATPGGVGLTPKGPFGSTDGGTQTPGTAAGSTGGALSASGGAKPASNIITCSGLDCRLCDLAALGQNYINTAVGLSIPFAALIFAVAGILYFTSGANPSGIEKAHRLFKYALIGFLIAISAWIAVQLFLKTTLSADYYRSWNSIQCVDNNLRPGTILSNGTTKGNTTNVGDIFGSLGGLNTDRPSVTVSGTTGSGVYTCGSGTLSGNTCILPDGSTKPADVNPNAYVNQNFSGGGCAGLSAQAACVVQEESSCNPLIGSGVDLSENGKGPPVSWGCFQINISANPVGGLNCPAAFGGGAYTAKNKDTYVVNQDLYYQCVTAAQNSCTEDVFNAYSKNGSTLKPWGKAAQIKCAGL